MRTVCWNELVVSGDVLKLVYTSSPIADIAMLCSHAKAVTRVYADGSSVRLHEDVVEEGVSHVSQQQLHDRSICRKDLLRSLAH